MMLWLYSLLPRLCRHVYSLRRVVGHVPGHILHLRPLQSDMLHLLDLANIDLDLEFDTNKLDEWLNLQPQDTFW